MENLSMSPFNRNKLKSWFMAAVAFGMVAISIDFVCTRLVINGSATSDAARISHLIREHGSEIPIFGTSKAYDDYIPEILGDDVFNYGMPATALDEPVALLQIECKKHKQTPIVLDLAHQGLRGIAEPVRFVPFVWRPEIRQMLDRLGLMERRYWVPGLRYFGSYDWFLMGYLKKTRARTDKFPKKLDEAIRRRLEEGFGFSSFPDQDRLLYDVIRSTPQRTFIIVISPVHPSCFANFKDPEGFARHLDKLRSFTNVVVLDWGRMKLADDCFRDTVHLSDKGALEFSRRLADQLRTFRAAAIPGTRNSVGAGVK
jgi:hypothetical protein